MPGPTIIGFLLRYFTTVFSNECITSGTTDDIITSLILLVSIFLLFRRFVINIPNSSEVLCIFVVILNVVVISSFSNTPSVMFVFPMSTTNSILFLHFMIIHIRLTRISCRMSLVILTNLFSLSATV